MIVSLPFGRGRPVAAGSEDPGPVSYNVYFVFTENHWIHGARIVEVLLPVTVKHGDMSS